MTLFENIFIFGTIALLCVLAVLGKNIPWRKLGLMPKQLMRGWWQVLLFSFAVFILVQFVLVNNLLDFPALITDKDPLIGLLVIVFLQELIFRGFIISWLEGWGTQKALWVSVIIFVMFHLIAPYTWTSTGLLFAGLTFVGGYFWGWHFLKFRNIYLLTVSHLIVNLSFNYLIFNLL